MNCANFHKRLLKITLSEKIISVLFAQFKNSSYICGSNQKNTSNEKFRTVP